MKAITINTDRLILKKLTADHLSAAYVNWMNDPEVNKYLESGGDYTIDKLNAFLIEQEKKNILFWAIHLKENGRHIGNIKIDPIDQENLSGEYGIMIGDKAAWGKGFAKEASLAVIQYCFREIGLKHITLGVVDQNQAALQLYHNIGFRRISETETTNKYNGVHSKTIRMSISR
ncbi:GNAT family N-acetyltransferase [Haoranjiania flava]|uniref:GNAT family N-acetyltransferase n=1 Tax=Haoranjiania flava TaxID=1856322 RepID=A0AAE3IP54_9BACT|nr:GNAT family N-acetyltransferase [Haoranjiania flava]MCU7694596.1 GNAT family N-acetyltransferase [Haoranjiania flava]